MQTYSADCLKRIGTDIFATMGAPIEEAAIVADQLVASNLVGLDSHGVVRIPQYVGWIRAGTICPGGRTVIHKEAGATAVLECGFNFGQVGGYRAMQVAIKKAREHKVACVLALNSCHVGRLGYFTHMAAEEGMFALAFVNSPKSGHSVVPFGGLEGRIAPNPISYAVPGPDHPMIADMTMSTTAQGKVVIHRNQSRPLPDGWIIDAAGNPSTDPNELFKSPRGWILPIGGSVGYKGFALLLLAELLSGTLAGNAITDDIPDGTNGLCFIVIDISAFLPVHQFRDAVGAMSAYIKATQIAPGYQEVMMPGDIDYRVLLDRQANGIPVDPVTWGSIEATARELGVDTRDL